MERTHLNTSKMKDKCSLISLNGDKHSISSNGLIWPAKNYACSFCKREFRSAQALGGHMNVHRRDRAKLRSQLPSWVFECPNPNPNFSSSSLSPSAVKVSPHTTHKYHNSLFSPSLASNFCKPTHQEKKSIPRNLLSPHEFGDLAKGKNKRAVLGVEELKSTSYAQNCDGLEVLKKEEVISLDLEMGFKDPKEVLDLELRLGYF